MRSALRGLVIALGIALLVAAAIVAFFFWPFAVELASFGVVILLGTFFEQHYRSKRATGEGWQTTGERFVDPVSGKLVQVRYNPQTGERAYEDVLGR